MTLKQIASILRRLRVPRRTLPAIREVCHQTIFSFVVDADPKFAYQGYHLARSLIDQCGGEPAAIHVQFTPEVSATSRQLFAELGCTLHDVERLGDGRYCSKVVQLENLLTYDFAHAVLLDTAVIAVADLRPYMGDGAALQAKVVDFSNPSLCTLQEIGARAGMGNLPARVPTDAGDGYTYLGNCDGGFYAIPKVLCPRVAATWRHWILWLLANTEPLAREGKEDHVDQVAIWLTIHMSQIAFLPAPSNINYFVHRVAEHRYFNADHKIALIRYADASLNVFGLLEAPTELGPIERTAIAEANRQIASGFENRLFWNLRYSQFSERGSGIGSRGENLMYKRDLLRREGAERAESVLDFGCGDLEVVKALNLKGYLGVDCSDTALVLARRRRPDWTFQRFMLGEGEAVIPPRHFVICFEVLIHQRTSQAYHHLIKFLADHTLRTLIVSGYDETPELSHMLFFYEPLETSLRRTGRFNSIRRIGAHTSVTIFRCDV
jgi:hypothetical protein